MSAGVNRYFLDEEGKWRERATGELMEAVHEETVRRFDFAATSATSATGPASREGETATHRPAGSDRFLAGPVIGSGGMALVCSARQVALARDVALKSLRESRRSPEDVHRLKREAQIMAVLEHPNIVPVYDMDQDESEVPFIAMKRVVGQPWRLLMHSEERVRELGESRDLLDWNMSVMLTVCDAVRFAHSRGVIHRDLKPENIMVGAYGEIYVVDWGIAVRLADGSKSARVLPWVGTPAYMAPEMIASSPRVSRATDVYALGGMLFELLAGYPPHKRRTREAVEKSILGSPPALPKSVDQELGAIVHRAMQRDPADRFASVEQLQRALRDHSRHRSSSEAVQLSIQRLADFRVAVQRADLEGARGAYANVVRKLEEALSEWSENDRARSLLEEVRVEMARFELAQERPHAALLLLQARRESAPPDLIEACDEAIKRQERDLARGRANDPAKGFRPRTIAIAAVAVVGIGIPLWHFAAGYVPTARGLALTDIMTLGAVLVSFFWRGVLDIRLHRGLVMLVGSVALARLVLVEFRAPLSLTPDTILCLSFLLWSMLTAGFAVLLSARILGAVVGYLIGFVLSVGHPERAHAATVFGHAVFLATMLWHHRAHLKAHPPPSRHRALSPPGSSNSPLKN